MVEGVCAVYSLKLPTAASSLIFFLFFFCNVCVLGVQRIDAFHDVMSGAPACTLMMIMILWKGFLNDKQMFSY